LTFIESKNKAALKKTKIKQTSAYTGFGRMITKILKIIMEVGNKKVPKPFQRTPIPFVANSPTNPK
jgi:hypothetical protein